MPKLQASIFHGVVLNMQGSAWAETNGNEESHSPSSSSSQVCHHDMGSLVHVRPLFHQWNFFWSGAEGVENAEGVS